LPQYETHVLSSHDSPAAQPQSAQQTAHPSVQKPSPQVADG
jgi:hypothetical protein